MRRLALVISLLILSPVTGWAEGPIQPTHRPVSGVVNAVDPNSRQLTVGREKFTVPKDVYDLSSVSEGQFVIVHWQQRGQRRVATQLERDLSAD